MKAKPISSTILATITLALPASADVIYSNLQNIAIPATYDGVYLNVENSAWNTNMFSPVAGWDINPYFGGTVLYNSPDFQPVRSGTGSMDAVLNLSLGTAVSGSSVFSTFVQGSSGENPGGPGYGGSQTHVGSTFTAGQEGYLGFKLNGANFGWMRVIFTNNTGGALIKDWAYENSGAAIVTGRVQQGAVSGGAQTFTLSPGAGESFTLSSSITNTGGNINSLVKTGDGTSVLTSTSTYTGATNVNAGKLVVNGNISTSSLTTVAAGATLGGSGTLGKTVVQGTIAVGNSPGQMNFTDTLGLNGTTVMEIDGMAGAGVTGGHDFINLTGSGAAGVLTYGGALTLDIGTLFSVGSYSWNLFDMASTSGAFQTISLVDQYSGNLLDNDFDGVWDLVSASNTWRFTGSDGVLSLTVVPEPRSALLVALGMIAFLRRRRAVS